MTRNARTNSNKENSYKNKMTMSNFKMRNKGENVQNLQNESEKWRE